MSEPIPDDVKKLAHITAETVLRNLPDDYAQAIMLDRSTRPSTGEVGVRATQADFNEAVENAILECASRPPTLRGPWVMDETTLQQQAASIRQRRAALISPPATVATGEHPPTGLDAGTIEACVKTFAEMGVACADPMWADHVELPKSVLRKWIKALRPAIRSLTPPTGGRT